MMMPTEQIRLHGSAVFAVRGVAGTSEKVVFFNPTSTQVMMTSSTDGSSWTEPVLVHSASGGAIVLSACYTGVHYTIAVRSDTGAVTLLDSTNLTTWTNSRNAPAGTTSITCSNGTYYATVEDSNVIILHRSTTGATWESYAQLSALNDIPNVDAIISENLYTVMREGSGDPGFADRILGADTRVTTPVHSGAILQGACAGAFVYHDLTAFPPPWGWMHYENDRWLRQWTFGQQGHPGPGDVFVIGDGFGFVYQVDDALYYREMVDAAKQIPIVKPQPGSKKTPAAKVDRLENFNVEISFGDQWVSIADGFNFRIDPTDFGSKAQQLRKITASSNSYDGTYLIHATKENVTENLTVTVYGQTQNIVTENLAMLEEIVSQHAFRIRLTFGDHRETWLCQQSDYSIERGHIFMHNTMAQFKMSVSRLPRVTYEVNI